jgi:predicted dehydrogenase
MEISRRELAAGLAGTIIAPGRALGANERIRMAFVGISNRGSQLLEAALPNKDIEIVAICDVWDTALDKWSSRLGAGAKRYKDYRPILERKDVDAMVFATPDHWHALQMIQSCDAGKDVYVEKPLSYTIKEGRKMVEAARRNNRIVQVGLMRRSSKLYTGLVKRMEGDAIGKVTVARAYRISNMAPTGIGIAPDSDPPPGLDWDMWLGPRPARRFNSCIAPYKFRWWKSYSSQLANWGVHYFDALRWILGEEAPVSISAHGGKYAVEDSRDIPDTLEVIYEFASGRLMTFGQYEASGYKALEREIELRGTNGYLQVDDRGYEIIPETGGQFQSRDPRMKPERVLTEKEDLDRQHMRNFLDCIKSRSKPNCDVEEGHRSTVFAHLGNIALATRQRIEWDPKTETITSPRSANSLLQYAYRSPWKL